MFTKGWKSSYQKVESPDLDSTVDESLDGSLEKEYYSDTPERTNSSLKRNASIIATIMACGVIFLIAINLPRSLPNTQTQSTNQEKPCGNNSAEALARGCTFDQLMWSWFPPHCPHYANTDYMAEKQEWRFYSNPYTKEVVSGENWTKVLDNEFRVYGERGEHLTHCVYMFLNLGQILRDGGRYTQKHVDYLHIHHCSTLLLEALRKDDRWDKIESKAGWVSYDQDC